MAHLLLVVLSLLSLPPLGINAHYLALGQLFDVQDVAPAFLGLGVAVGVLTVVTAPTM